MNPPAPVTKTRVFLVFTPVSIRTVEHKHGSDPRSRFGERGGAHRRDLRSPRSEGEPTLDRRTSRVRLVPSTVSGASGS
jgi:hypothetical protein